MLRLRLTRKSGLTAIVPVSSIEDVMLLLTSRESCDMNAAELFEIDAKSTRLIKTFQRSDHGWRGRNVTTEELSQT